MHVYSLGRGIRGGAAPVALERISHAAPARARPANLPPGSVGRARLPKELFSPLRQPTVVTNEHIVVTVTISGGAEPL
jgi:hypothetical protein